MKTLSKKQQIANAPKFVLYNETLGFLANKQNLTGVIFTEELELAMQFAEGFDNPSDKLEIWNLSARKYGKNIFEAVLFDSFV